MGGGRTPACRRARVVLTGDFYCGEALTRRGETGDVGAVWEAFAIRFGFVTGAAGNHDTFGNVDEREAFLAGAGAHLLDLDVVEVGGLIVGGLSGIVGDGKRANRRAEDDHLENIRLLLPDRSSPDIIVIHESPMVAEYGLKGNEGLRTVLDGRSPTLVVYGHVHWAIPLVELPRGT